MSDARELQELQAKLERAAAAPPQVDYRRRVPLPMALRPALDSRGRRRQVMANSGKARQHQIEKARREMVAQAKTEIIARAKEQLKP